MSESSQLEIWTIYDHPLDYPKHFVARPYYVGSGATAPGVPVVADSLEECRALLPPGLARIPRHPSDEPQIVESWV